MIGMDGAVEPIAVVGMAARVPGARDIEEFWRNLVDGRESVTFWDAGQLRAAGVDDVTAADPDYVPAAPALPDVDMFDAALFGMTRREAELCDPQLRIFLEICHSALEHAGYDPFGVPDSVGVFGAAGPGYYFNEFLRHRPDLVGPAGMLAGTLNHVDYLAPLVAYKLDLKGPAMTVLTACSSTLVAVHLACQALRTGECDTALAGGSVVRLPYGRGYRWTPGSVLSQDGHCRPFDADATGTVFGSGAGAVVLKRLDDAYADGDRVLAVVAGSAVNNDGADKLSFSAPSVSGQAAVIAEAMALAGVAPEEVGYVEAHATGTALGDPVEVAALAQAYRSLSDELLRPGVCVLGAVKSNVGHLDAAAGITGFIKTVLALQREAIPATVHLRQPNPRLELDSTPFTLAGSLRRWVREPGRRRVAGVTSLGVGGTNAHVVITEGPEVVHQPSGRQLRVLAWSAGGVAGERRLRAELARFFAGEGVGRFADAVATLQHGRGRHSVRAAVVCDSAEAAVAALTDAPGAAPVLTGEAGECDVAFLVPGQGDQRLHLARGLYGTVREFTVPMDECLEQLELAGLDVYKSWTEEALPDPALDQPLCFAIAYAFATMWRRAGVEPVAVIGHGLGELTAATIAGVFPLPVAARLVAGHAMGGWADSFAGVSPVEPRVACYSAHLGGEVGAGDLARPDFWAGALAGAEKINAVLEAVLTERRPGALLELGPPTAFTDQAQHAQALAGTVVLPTLGDGRDDRRDLLTAAAQLWLRGARLDWAGLGQPTPGVRVALPGYPYERQRYWADPPPAATMSTPDRPAPDPRAEAPVTTIGWVECPPPGPPPAATGTALVLLPDSGADEERVRLAVQHAGLRLIAVRPGADYAERAGEYRVRPDRTEDWRRMMDRLVDSRSTPDAVVHAATCRAAEPGSALDDRLRTGFFSLLAQAKAILGGSRWPALPRLVLLTSHSVDVSGGEPVDPARAALHGLLRSVLAESPQLTGVGVDVDGRVEADDLARELADSAGAPVVALRGRRRWLPEERPVPLHPGGGTGLRDQGRYVITGGAGGLGLAVARALAGTGLRPRIALLGRRAPLVAPRTLDELRERGAVVRAYACDVTDQAAVEAVVAEVSHEWGPVHGLFHLAGVPGERMVAFRDAADAAAVLAPKTAGTRVLERVFAERQPLDFAVFFSSRAATEGLVGGGDYAAANAYLDGAALASPLAGGRVLSIGWPVWRGAGMAEASDVDIASLGESVRRRSAARAYRRREDSGPAALAWERELSDATDWTLDEHRLGSVPLLPGTAMMDLTLRALRETVGWAAGAAVELSDVVFRVPFLDRSPRLVRIAFRPVDQGYDVELASRPTGGDGAWSTHATSRVDPAAPAVPAALSLSELRDRFDVAGVAEPEPAARSAFMLGPRWRNVTRRWSLADELLLRVELPPAYHADLAEHPLHPALLDTVTAAVRRAGQASSVPFHYRRLTVYAPLPARFYAYVRRAAEALSGDLDLIADDGSTLARVEGFTMVMVEPDRLHASAPGAPSRPPERAEPTDEVIGLDLDDGVDLLLRMLDAGTVGHVLVRPYRAGRPLPLTSADPPPVPVPEEPVPVTAAPLAPTDPGNSLADLVGVLWRETLGLDTVEPDRDFFDAGGDSLSAIELTARIRETLGVDMGVGVMLQARTLDDLVAFLRARSGH